MPRPTLYEFTYSLPATLTFCILVNSASRILCLNQFKLHYFLSESEDRDKLYYNHFLIN